MLFIFEPLTVLHNMNSEGLIEIGADTDGTNILGDHIHFKALINF